MAKAKAAFTLTRILPDGTTRIQGPVTTARAAAVLASRVLADNRLAGKADAQRFAADLSRLPVGTAVRHEPSDYTFIIDRHESHDMAVAHMAITGGATVAEVTGKA